MAGPIKRVEWAWRLATTKGRCPRNSGLRPTTRVLGVAWCDRLVPCAGASVRPMGRVRGALRGDAYQRRSRDPPRLPEWPPDRPPVLRSLLRPDEERDWPSEDRVAPWLRGPPWWSPCWRGPRS